MRPRTMRRVWRNTWLHLWMVQIQPRGLGVMTTDNRTNEPNKYAGFLARQNHQRDPWRGVGVKCLCGKLFDLDADRAMHQVDEILRAAIVAAGVAPQEPSKCSNPQCPLDRAHSGPCAPEGWSPDREKLIAEARDRAAHMKMLAGDLIQELIDLKAAPVLPSSGVDEDKLADVIEHAETEWQLNFNLFRSEIGADPGPKTDYTARAVAEWLKGQGR